MLPQTGQAPKAARAAQTTQTVQAVDDRESLFDRHAWLYALCRERLFQDHTRTIVDGLWPGERPRPGSMLLDVGCGPGFYALRLAERFRHLDVVGIDRSKRQLVRARALSAARGLTNCRFEEADARALPRPDGSADGLIAARVFTVLHEREPALAEIHRVLRPGGRCFIAEPRSAVRASLPLMTMWLLAGAWRLRNLGTDQTAYREPRCATVMDAAGFDAFVRSQDWRAVAVWQDATYHFAVCEKGVSSS
jgi:arsenite methyltransferase